MRQYYGVIRDVDVFGPRVSLPILLICAMDLIRLPDYLGCLSHNSHNFSPPNFFSSQTVHTFYRKIYLSKFSFGIMAFWWYTCLCFAHGDYGKDAITHCNIIVGYEYIYRNTYNIFQHLGRTCVYSWCSSSKLFSVEPCMQGCKVVPVRPHA